MPIVKTITVVTIIDRETYTIVHEYDENGNHRLAFRNKAVNTNKIGEWAGYNGIAKCGGYCATTEYFHGVLPELFTVNEVK